MHLDPQIANALAEVVAALITAFGGWVVFYVERRFHLDRNAKAEAIFEKVAANGIALASAKIGQKIAGGAVVNDKVGEIATEALTYITPKVQDEIIQLGISPASLPDRVAARVAVAAGATPANV
jgi:hypothetical protein